MSTYTICGAVGLVREWFLSGMKQDIDSFAAFLAKRIVEALNEL